MKGHGMKTLLLSFSLAFLSMEGLYPPAKEGAVLPIAEKKGPVSNTVMLCHSWELTNPDGPEIASKGGENDISGPHPHEGRKDSRRGQG